MKEYNFETYTLNPETGETGWDIVWVSVIANTREEAIQFLKTWDLFDCIITYTYGIDLIDDKFVEDTQKNKIEVRLGELWEYRHDEFSKGYKLIKRL